MSLKRLIPERTVDSILAYELIRALPTAVLWSPTNVKDSFDHELQAGGSSAILFECKAVTEKWRIPVGTQQLNTYVGRGLGHILYVFPARPIDDARPWIRSCSSDADTSGACRACWAPLGSDNRRWAGGAAHVAAAPIERKAQPWFNHWAWALTATDLKTHLGSSVKKTHYLSAEDLELESLSGVDRLCHLLAPRLGIQPLGDTGPEGDGPGKDLGNDGAGDDVGDMPKLPDSPARSVDSDTPRLPRLYEHAIPLENVRGYLEQVIEYGRRTRPGSVGLLV